jgi:glycosyltransferase involved in cell wall biosynthesis
MDFTIVTPSHRQLNWLACCIASVADQQGVSLEHRVQDAGTKGFADFAKKMQERWPDREGYRRVMISEPDGGMYDAINKGLKCGSGRICAYLNCDEQYLPGALAKVKEEFDRNPKAEILYGGFLVVDGQGRLITAQRPVPMFWPHVATSHLPNFTCATFFLRSMLEQRQAWFNDSMKTCADWTWSLKRIREGARIIRSPQPLSLFRETGQNQGLSVLGMKERQKVLETQARWVRAGAVIWKCVHWVRKLCAGGYFPFQVKYSLWMRGKDAGRTRVGPCWSHGIWWSRLVSQKTFCSRR